MLPSHLLNFVKAWPSLDTEDVTLQSLADDACLWLMGHCDDDKPDAAAMGDIASHWTADENTRNTSESFCRRHLIHLLQLVFARPNSYATVVFDAYRTFMASFKFNISTALKAYESKVGVDLARCLKILGPERIKFATNLYLVPMSYVLVEAIATDDVELFNLVCSNPDSGAYPYYKWESLARFEDAPQSAITLQCSEVSSEQGKLKIYKARAELIRNVFEPKQPDRYLSYMSRNPPGSPKTLNVGVGSFPQWIERKDDADTFYRTPAFKSWVVQHPVDAIKAIYWPSLHLEIHDPEHWAMVDEVTQIVLDAGVRPGELITFGPLNRGKYGSPVLLDEAVNFLGHLSEMNFRFYVQIYAAYLRMFSIEQIIEACEQSDRSLLGAYKVLRDQRLLQAMGDEGRSRCMASDLGL